MATGTLELVIEVEGYEDIEKPKAYEISLKMSAKLKKTITNWMIKKIRERVALGLNVDGEPFAPLKTGEPSTLNRTGALLAGIKAAKTSDINAANKTRALVQLGITDIVNGDPDIRYPWYLHYGVDPDRIRARLLQRLNSRLTIKTYRLERKYRELSQASASAVATRMHLLDTIEGVKKDIYELREEIFRVENREFSTIKARKWWGLTADERETIDNALSDWFHLMVEGAVGSACNPEKEPPAEVSKRVEAEIMKRFT